MTQPRWQWAQAMICAAYPELDGAAAGELTIGQRDARLLALREALFGRALVCRSHCPACKAVVETTVDSSSLCVPAANENPATVVRAGEWDVRFRVPTARDLDEAARAANPGGMRTQLLERCILGAEQAGVATDLRGLSAAALEQVVSAMSAADPQADVRLELSCPECRNGWSEAFDIVSFLWAEVDDWAQRLLRDIHVLATAYGWTEFEVLALSPQRRALYLEMCDA